MIGRWIGRMTDLYERAPVRQMLDIDPIGALDWIVVVVARRLVRLLPGAHTTPSLEGAESSSGCRGNVVFVIVWTVMIGGVVLTLF